MAFRALYSCQISPIINRSKKASSSKKGEPELAWTEEKSDLDDDGSDLSNFVRWLDDEWREHELEG